MTLCHSNLADYVFLFACVNVGKQSYFTTNVFLIQPRPGDGLAATLPPGGQVGMYGGEEEDEDEDGSSESEEDDEDDEGSGSAVEG